MRARVTAQAFRVDFFGRGLGGVEDLGNIAAAFHVSSTRPMTAFAIHSGRAVLCRKLRVRVSLELFGYFFMASSADFSADVCTRSSVFTLRDGWCSCSRGLRGLRPKRNGAKTECACQYHQAHSKCCPLSRGYPIR